MVIFWDAGLVLLAVPKTGTQALEEAFSQRADIVFRHPPLTKHMPLGWFRRKILPLFAPEDQARLKSVAVIREPVDWLGSWYRYRTRGDILGTPNSTAGMDFATFAEGYLSDAQPSYATVGSQGRFLQDNRGRIAVDHLFAYERMDELLDFLEDRVGLAGVTPPIRNASPERPLDLPDQLRKRLRESLAFDIELHAATMRK
ncbi:gamma-glutamyl kinase [Roseicyclus sp. F158]|uniref:Gamma-glutamyl kinase n=1 Tax=Tropicimonas omnivorans TaxID=3075590 RepID=A0ABU3DK63_9RHOB|nr:gamma-glutamyl kinase [Roseicyclus sp. F158]MDT0684109.1 gamma-glutamyl kinase [Roseicyclus sp. F158]